MNDKLDGWKAIASHLERNVRTAQRWEKSYGLPVRRVGDSTKAKSASVFAFRDELDEWLTTHHGSAAAGHAPAADGHLLGLGWVLSLVAVAVAVAVLGTAIPSRDPDAGIITFVSDRTGRFEVWTMNPDGSGQRQLSSVNGSAFRPRRSPDGERIVFIQGSRRQSSLYVMNKHGGEQRVLLQESDVGGMRFQDLSWSPDGTVLAVAVAKGCCSGAVWLLDSASDTVSQLSSGAFTSMVSFSPDGTRLAYNERLEDASYAHPLRIMDLDGTNRVLATRQCCSEDSTVVSGDWSPDDQLLISLGHNLWTFYVRVPQLEQITHDGSLMLPLDYQYPTWSPVAKRIAYVRATATEQQIWRAEADGTVAVQLTHKGNNTHPDWWDRGERVTAAVGKPDLTIADFRISPANPTSNELIFIEWTAKNVGRSHAGDFGCRLYIDGLTRPENFNRCNERFVLHYDRGPFEPGMHALRVVIDTDDEVSELDETNNEATMMFRVGDEADESVAARPPGSRPSRPVR